MKCDSSSYALLLTLFMVEDFALRHWVESLFNGRVTVINGYFSCTLVPVMFSVNFKYSCFFVQRDVDSV